MFGHCLLLFAYLSVVTAGYAQVATNLSGSVIDATGAVVPGAAVTLRLPGSEATLYVATTTSNGVYTLPSVNPGTYDLAIQAVPQLSLYDGHKPK